MRGLTLYSRVIVPTHPSFGGTGRPAALTTIRDPAALYVALIGQPEAGDMTVIGNSIGGWITAEMALLAPPRIGRAALVDAAGIEYPDTRSPVSSPSPWTRSSPSASTTPRAADERDLELHQHWLLRPALPRTQLKNVHPGPARDGQLGAG
jgi:pimeloyl-ACP methyl ester carboxylesterase